MKFKRTLSAIYSSALVLGLTFLLYPQSMAATASKSAPTVTPSPDITPTLAVAITGPTDSPALTSEPSATPTDSPAYVHPLYTNELTTPGTTVTDLVTAYLEAYYDNDTETISSLVTDAALIDASAMEAAAMGVKSINDLKLYAKPGINGIFSVVYATYSLDYGNSKLSMPQFSELYIKRNSDGSYHILTEDLPEDTQKIMVQARESEAILKMTISALIRSYNNACLTGNEQLLKQYVTDFEYLDMNYFTTRFTYTEYFSDYNFYIRPGINEFDYIVYVTYKEKIVLIDTSAPCMECFYIYIDPETGQPYIYLGITSLDTDAYCAAITQSSEIQSIADATNRAMTEALVADDDLKDFYTHLSNSR